MSYTTPQPADPFPPVVNVEQAEAWNGDDGRHWVNHRDRFDTMLAALTPHLLRAAEVSPGQRVLDVGCGSGFTTCAAARAAQGGEAVGADLSGLLVEQARQRAEQDGLDNVRFEWADAQVHPFPAAGFDVAISRFGVMFFADPAAAFANVARALTPGGRLAFLSWQQPLDNEWVVTLGAALSAHVELPKMDEEGPGPFSLADPERIRSLLDRAGFVEIAVAPVVEPFVLGSDVADAMLFLEGLGLVRKLLAEADSATRTRALDAIRDALAAHRTEQGVQLGSAAWLVTARRGPAASEQVTEARAGG